MKKASRSCALVVVLLTIILVSCRNTGGDDDIDIGSTTQYYSGWAALAHAIQLYNQKSGHWVVSIQELESNGYLPDGFRYATKHGTSWQDVNDKTFVIRLLAFTENEATYHVTVLGVELGKKRLVRIPATEDEPPP